MQIIHRMILAISGQTDSWLADLFARRDCYCEIAELLYNRAPSLHGTIVSALLMRPPVIDRTPTSSHGFIPDATLPL